MNRCLGIIMAGLVAPVFLGTALGKGDKAKPQAADAEAASCHGTAVEFVNTPSEAAREAKKQEKLVFVLHVSGQFEDPGIT